MSGQNLRATGDRIEQLLDTLHTRAEPAAYGQIEELLRLVTDLYGAGLGRIVELVGAEHPALLEAMAADDLVASLLLIHDLHPSSLRVRVERALAEVRPLLQSHGGDVELLEVDDEVSAVRLRLLGTCEGCPSSSVTLTDAVEAAIVTAAPEITAIDVDGASGVSTPVSIGTKPGYDACPAPLLRG